jgi:uncharacterized membrane protein YidH (DUF202 family)
MMTQSMAAQNAAASEQTLLARWRRDYRLSLVLIVAGIVMAVTYLVFGVETDWTGNYPTSLGVGLAIYLIGTAGGMLILLGGTVAYYHRKGLRLMEGDA